MPNQEDKTPSEIWNLYQLEDKKYPLFYYDACVSRQLVFQTLVCMDNWRNEEKNIPKVQTQGDFYLY